MVERTSLERDALPIPTYDEAISRPSSVQSFANSTRARNEEAQRLLSHDDALYTYRAPTVESARSSIDSSSPLDGSTDLLQGFEEMEIIEPSRQGALAPGGGRFSNPFTMLTQTLSTLHLPQLPNWMPNLGQLRENLPSLETNWILFGRFFALALVLSLAYLIFFSNLFRLSRSGVGRNWIEPEALRNYVLDHVDVNNIKSHLTYLTSFPHMAGTEGSRVQADYIKAQFAKTLDEVQLERFDVFLNFPKKDKGTRKVAIVEPKELSWETLIEENPVYPHDPSRGNTPVFHAFSKSGTVQGPLIYANNGLSRDYDHLKAQGIDFNGSIVMVRHNEHDRALKVRAAELAGAVGCIIYSDPAEDRFIKGKEFPEARVMPPDGVHRDSVALTAWRIGDPLTPGLASLPSEKRRDSREDNVGLNHIPSIPIAWRDAQKLLQAIQGHGTRFEGERGVGAVPDLEYWTGDNSSPLVQLTNELDEVERSPIFNIVGKITGNEQPEKRIIVGSHLDSWCFLGAAGGTAVILEVLRILNEFRRLGWRPLRTIEFASWSASEYNLIGSTEHVESYIAAIRRDALAYINVDVAVTGSEFRAAASPILTSAILHVLDRVPDFHYNKTLRALFAERGGVVEGLDAGSDAAPFQMLAGCSSINVGFGGPPYPHHSCYDTLEWMEKSVDFDYYDYHQILARAITLLILELADSEILSFDLQAYAYAISHEIGRLEEETQSVHYLNYSALHLAAKELAENAEQFEEWSSLWHNTGYESGSTFESRATTAKRISYNTRMANFETNLLDIDGGLPGREQFKHVFLAPSKNDRYQTSYFPFIRDAVETFDWELASIKIQVTAAKISYAAKKLMH